MGIASHYGEMNAQKGIFGYQSILLGIDSLCRSKEVNNTEYIFKLNLIKEKISSLSNVHVVDSVKNCLDYTFDLKFINGLVEKVEKGLIDVLGEEIIPVLNKIQGMYPMTKF